MPLEGRLIRLRAIEREDLEQLRQWRNDPKLRRFFRTWREINREKQQWYFENIVMGKDHVVFGIERKSDGKLIGECRLSYIDWRKKSAEVGIFLGNEESRNRGYGTEALQILVKFGFEEAGLHRIYSESTEDNLAAIKLFKKVGFKEEGVLRDSAFYEGRYHNTVLLSMLEERL